MKIASRILSVALLALVQNGQAQGFINLNFESADVSSFSTGFVPATNAFPGWTAYVGGNQVGGVVYNTRPLDAAEVTLQGTNSDSLTPIQGQFTAILFGASIFAPQESAAIGQTGQIPLNALSLTFWGYSSDVSFAGQALSLVVLGTTPDYYIYGADISAFCRANGTITFYGATSDFKHY
ncbi:MAG TPA: hypothetical protein VIK28_03430 [Sedimentisphaerales bacterium]